YTKLIIILVSLVLITLIKKESVHNYLNKLSVALLILAIANLLLSFDPKKLSPENIALKQTSDYLNTLAINGKEIYYNHAFIPFYSDKFYKESPMNFKRLLTGNLKDAKPGSIMIWDSHYSYRPKDMKNDVQLEMLKNDSAYKLLQTINSNDNRFSSFVFEKVN
ncbi:MAG: hypothetical protein ABIY50_12035, partial [Ignavibacteria bacterium]